MKRRILAMILGLVMVLSMAACGGNSSEETVPGHIRIGSLKGPTSMGLVQLMDRAEKGETPIIQKGVPY